MGSAGYVVTLARRPWHDDLACESMYIFAIPMFMMFHYPKGFGCSRKHARYDLMFIVEDLMLGDGLNHEVRGL